MSYKINKKQVKSIADKSEKIGDSCLERYEKSKKIDLAKVGISAFRNTLYANALLLKSDKID